MYCEAIDKLFKEISLHVVCLFSRSFHLRYSYLLLEKPLTKPNNVVIADVTVLFDFMTLNINGSFSLSPGQQS